MSHALADSFAMAGVVVGRVLKGDSLTRALGEVQATGSLRAAVQSLAYAALRDYGRADAILAKLVVRPPTPSLQGLLLAAIVELERGPQAAHAVVHQAVEAAARVAPRGAQSARGLVNGVLRNVLRQGAALRDSVLVAEPGRYRYPQWWIDRVRAAWPDQWEALLEAGNNQAPMTLRVNQRQSSGKFYLEQCRLEGIEGVQVGPQAIRLDKPAPVENLLGFSRGVVSVQDWAAQQAAVLLDVQPGQRVLDACAAPGGKTAHIAERVDCALTAVDSDAERLLRVHDNLRRLHLSARVVNADALSNEDQPIGIGFDRILLDAPCSASGVVRRHPDIKWLRRDSDLERLRKTQAAMLRALWRRLAPGGRMVYATCSVFPEENGEQIAAFLAECSDAVSVPISAMANNITCAVPSGSGTVSAAHPNVGCQILPGPDADGFFYAVLERKS